MPSGAGVGEGRRGGEPDANKGAVALHTRLMWRKDLGEASEALVQRLTGATCRQLDES